MTLSTNSPKETEALGEAIGKNLKGGEVIELLSDIGGGKTTFVRGLARGAGSKDGVSSPTFTISNQYRAKDFDLYHYDFYRLNEPGLMKFELAENLGQKDAVVLIEWSDIVESALPKKRLRIEFLATDETKRKLKIDCPDSLKYVLETIE